MAPRAGLEIGIVQRPKGHAAQLVDGMAHGGKHLADLLIFAFGLCFQLPVLLVLLGRAGLVTPEQLAKGRRYAIVVAFVVAAVLTPPDVLSQFALAVPIILLYEISILIIRYMQRKDDAQ